MYNPFKKSFLIEKIEKLNGESYYTIKYGNWWFYNYIISYGSVCVHYSESLCNIASLENARDVIKLFWTKELEKRLSQSATTQSFKI